MSEWDGADGYPSLGGRPFICFKGMLLMISMNQRRGEHLFDRFPGIVSHGITLPFDEVL